MSLNTRYKLIRMKPDVEVKAFDSSNSSTQAAVTGSLCEFKVSLVYIENARILARATYVCSKTLSQVMPSVTHSLLLLPVVQDVEISAPPAPHLPGCYHVSHPEGNGLNP